MRAFVTAIVVMARVARADPKETEALAHLDRGVAAYRAHDYALAKGELDEAHRLAPDKPNPYRWLALTEAELGNCKDALVDIESFLSRVSRGDARVPEMIALRERCVLELRPTPPPPPPALQPASPPPPPPPPAPEGHRWWLWGAIGGAAVVAGVVTFALVHDSGPAQLPPITCGATGCH